MGSISAHVVIDTNVVFEGLTTQGGACGLILDAWRSGLLNVYVSNALAYEYEDVLARKLSELRWNEVKPVLGHLLNDHVEFVTVHFTWRPISPDPGDDHVIDCAMNANASVITLNLRDFTRARQALGLSVMTPVEFINSLTTL